MKKFLTSLLALSALISAFSGTSFAAGSASLTLSPASGTYNNGSTINVGVYENGSNVNTVTVSLSYDSSKLQLVNTSCAGVFSNKIGSGSTITCYINPGDPAVSGSQLAATASFTAISGSGTTAVTFGSNSVIASNGTNVWNGSANGGTYTLATPATPPSNPSNPSQPTSGSGTTSPRNTGTSNTAANSTNAKSSNSSKTTNSSAVVKNNTSATGTVASAGASKDTPRSVGKKVTTKLAASNTSTTERNGFPMIIVAVIAALIVAATAWTLRNRKLFKLSSVKVFSKNK